MKESNELLRSAHEIAQRKGEYTNWEAFENNLREELLKQAGVGGSTDKQIILRATVTPKTYRLYQGESTYQERVIKEKEELHIRAKALSNFIGHNSTFNTLPAEDQELMKEQCEIMWEYYEVLEKRVVRF